MSARPLSAALLCGLMGGLMAAEPARAHPHIFVDGGADFLFDAQGRLAAVRVIWHYDAMASLFTVEALGIDADGDGRLTEAETATLIADQTDWPEEFEGDSYLWIGSDAVPLSRPRNAEARYEGGRIEIRFERALEAPAPTGGLDAELKLYDPGYYFAYFATHAPQIEGAPPGCAARVVPFNPDSGLAALQNTLSALSREETPEQQDVGALFADRILLECD